MEYEQMLVLGIATSVGRRGIGLGKTTLDHGLMVVEATKSVNQMDCAVFARIHPSNRPSQGLFASRGFVNLGAVEHPVLETWAHW